MIKLNITYNFLDCLCCLCVKEYVCWWIPCFTNHSHPVVQCKYLFYSASLSTCRTFLLRLVNGTDRLDLAVVNVFLFWRCMAYLPLNIVSWKYTAYLPLEVLSWTSTCLDIHDMLTTWRWVFNIHGIYATRHKATYIESIPIQQSTTLRKRTAMYVIFFSQL